MMIFPQIFQTGERPEEYSRAQAIADGLSGWACCSFARKIPENFGHGMVAIGKELGIAATPKNIEREADIELAK